MNHEPTPTTQSTDGSRVGRAAVPMWLIVLTALLMFGGCNYFDSNGGWFDSKVYAPYRSVADLEYYQLPVVEGPDLRRGEAMFTVCAACHNTDGKGKPNQAPPLAGSDWVLGTPERLIRIPLAGLQGPIEVSGQKYNFPAGMTAIAAGGIISDDDLAAILSYIRQAWGNKAGEITAEQVKAIRTKVGNRIKPWSPEELKQF